MDKENAIIPVDETVKAMMQRRAPELMATLPVHVNYKRFETSAMLAIARAPKLMECDPLSLFTAVSNAAELGLDFTQAKGHAYLVPFWSSRNHRMEAQFIPGYRGLIELMRRAGDVKMICAHNVYKKDTFSIKYGTKQELIHEPCISGPRGDFVGAYAVVWYDDSLHDFMWMDNEALNKIKARSNSKDKKGNNVGPWITDEAEMRKKTVLRRIAKYVPISIDLEKAYTRDNETYEGSIIDLINTEDGKTGTDRLADEITGGMRDGEVVDDDTGEVTDAPSQDAAPEDNPKNDAENPVGSSEPAQKSHKSDNVTTDKGKGDKGGITDAEVEKASSDFKLNS